MLPLPRLPARWAGHWGPPPTCCGRGCVGVGVVGGRPRGGWPATVVRGVRGQALPLPRLPAHWAGCRGPPPTCCGRRCVGVEAQHCPLGLHALPGLRAVGVVGGRPRGGWPATVVRGVWCQALSLPRPPVLWGEQPGFRDPCELGAVGAGVGPSTGPTACALAGQRCSLWGWPKGVPGRLPSTVVRGVCCQALPLPELPAHWAGCWGPPPKCCGRGRVGVGAQHCPLGLHALWGLRAAGPVGERPRGGVACHRCEGRLLSGAVPPPAARPMGRAAGVLRPVCSGCGRCGSGDPPPAPQRAPCGPALLAVGPAEGRPGGWCLPPL